MHCIALSRVFHNSFDFFIFSLTLPNVCISRRQSQLLNASMSTCRSAILISDNKFAATTKKSLNILLTCTSFRILTLAHIHQINRLKCTRYNDWSKNKIATKYGRSIFCFRHCFYSFVAVNRELVKHRTPWKCWYHDIFRIIQTTTTIHYLLTHFVFWIVNAWIMLYFNNTHHQDERETTTPEGAFNIMIDFFSHHLCPSFFG